MLDKLKAFSKNLNPLNKALETAMGIKTMPSAAAVSFFNEWLPQQEAILASPDKLQSLMSTAEPICKQHFIELSTELMKGQLTKLRVQLFSSSLTPFTEMLFQAHLRCVQGYKSSLLSMGGDAVSPHAGLIAWGTRKLQLEFVTTHQAKQMKWTEVYSCAPLILQNKLPTASLSAAKIELAHFCLLATGLVSELEVRRIEIVNRLARMLAPFLIFTPQRSNGLCYLLSPSLEQPPALIKPEDILTEAQLENAVFLDINRVLDELRALEHMIGQQETLPTKLNYDNTLHVTEVFVTIRQLRDKWMGKVNTRRHDRRQLDRAALIAYEFPAIRRKVAGTEEKNSLASRAFAMGLDDGRIIDISQSGVGITIRAAPWAKVGLAVSIQIEGSARWVVGIIRRITAQEAESSMLLGIEILSLTPESVRLVEAAKMSVWETTTNVAAFENIFGVWIPPSAQSHQQAMILLEQKQVSIGKSYGIYYKGQKSKIRIKDLVEMGDNFFRYDVDIEATESGKAESNQQLDF
ncbi:PilZ domain-containing protein [Leeia sp. TBRC 13508]|uniref:PilZ domain-containing protein n=1 Tax=Leeia speluncae TaxID=2884804 RepID=A0ABS8D4P8_9NEIS|nr:PilZ domain-containing protein [Leeia speluncae]MCB6183154.1 PilZ domain-containing protein [Leeia speluncae]